MSVNEDSKVLILALPELFPANKLRKMLEERCSQIENLDSLSKERLVGIFRKIIFPFPQRIYRSNRRGKMLIARRIKSGLEGRKPKDTDEEGSLYKKHNTKLFDLNRLKPPPNNSSSKIKTESNNGGDGAKSKSHGDNFFKNNEERQSFEDKIVKKVKLKRQSEINLISGCEIKRSRTTIKWP